MDWQTVLSVFAVPVVGGICWIIFQLNSKMEETRQELSDYKVTIAETYLRKADAKEAFEKYDRVLERVELKIDRLQTAVSNARHDMQRE